LAGTSISNGLIGGFKAILLLRRENFTLFESLSPETWVKWIGAILLFPKEDKVKQFLLAEIYPKAADEIAKIIVARILIESIQWDFPITLRFVMKIPGLIDKALTSALLTALPTMKKSAASSTLKLLLETGEIEVVDFA